MQYLSTLLRLLVSGTIVTASAVSGSANILPLDEPPLFKPDALDRDFVLDLARDTAHLVARPAAPLTAYLAGVAVGRGASPADVDATIRSLLPPPPPEDSSA